MFIFSLVSFFLDRVFLGFRTPVVAITVCTTGGVHTHSPVARTFFCCTVCLRTSAHLHACHTHAWLKAQVSCKKVVCVCVLDLSISLSPSHDSPVFLAVLARSLRDLIPTTTSLLTPTSTWSCRTFPSWKCRRCATPHLHRDVRLPDQIRCKHRLWAQGVRHDHFRG